MRSPALPSALPGASALTADPVASLLAPVPAQRPAPGARPRAPRPGVTAALAPARPIEGDPDPLWFKGAVFYEVMVRSFQDSNGDGVGDLQGLSSRLDYLQWLGVDCVWLPPFFTSPLRDGGYDVADYTDVQAEFGDLGDFVGFVDAAHARGIRVVIDFVLNHTSDAHPWFQASRADPDGPYGDYYVWADDDGANAGVRVIFSDTETSNWAFDPVRRQYYWHRFYSHQPDLNYRNPRVREEVLAAIRFWLDLGIDGFRLDAVPYLYEQDGTDCENLPETHSFLKTLRALVDADYPDRVLLAEANQWPEDVIHYFGDPATGGDECHMAFHFPVMPRIFMAVRQHSAKPIAEIMARTPQIPEGCQWGIFLRNHDELTLEMVTDEERDYMYAHYAADPRMRANAGLRRRLAPLLDNDRRQIDLFTALLLSLPGTPVLYYGDEIAMGDNIWLNDRDAVRTPMQWTPDRNAGFSAADPGRLTLPVVMDPVYGHHTVNVEAQLASPHSLLHHTRRMLEIRRQHPAFGHGDHRPVQNTNPAILAYIRHLPGGHPHNQTGQDDTVLCVANLSPHPQPTQLELSEYQAKHLVELTGATAFPKVGELPYLLTLPGHGFYWFRLSDG